MAIPVQIKNEPINQTLMDIQANQKSEWYQNKVLWTRVGLVALAAISVVAGIAICKSYFAFNASLSRPYFDTFNVILIHSLMTVGLWTLPFIVGGALTTIAPICLLMGACSPGYAIDPFSDPEHLERERQRLLRVDLETILNQYSLEEIMKYNLIDKKNFDQKYQDIVEEEKRLQNWYDKKWEKKEIHGLNAAKLALDQHQQRKKNLDLKIENQLLEIYKKYPNSH